LDELKNIVSGSIRLATIYSIGLHELPFYVKKFLKAHPSVNVHVEYLRFNQVYEEVIGNTSDIGLVALTLPDASSPGLGRRMVVPCSSNNGMRWTKGVLL